MHVSVLENFVGGEFRSGTVGEPIPDRNPSDQDDLIGQVPSGTADDAMSAVASARSALDAWRTLPGPARAAHLFRWAAVIEESAEEMAQAVAREVGKPIGEARGEVGRCAVILRYYAGEAVRARG